VSLRRATGQASFVGDVALPGTLHLALRRSRVAHARVTRSDASAARSLPGVAAVFVAGEEGGLLPGVVRFVGDRLAVAAAEEPELARRAVDAVEIELEPLTAALDARAAALVEASVLARASATEGDVERALAEASDVVDGEWSLPFAPAISLEPPLAVTWLDEDRRHVVRTSAASPFRVRGILAERLGLPAARIRVVRPLVAGGSPGQADVAVEDMCALVTLRTGRPARLAPAAEEELTAGPGRPAQRVRVRLGVTGREAVALELRLLADLGASGERALDFLRSCGRLALGLYRVPNVRYEAVAVRTNRPPASAPPSGDGGVSFALECAVDEAALRLGGDPAAFRRRHLRAPGDPGALALAALGEPEGRDDARPLARLMRSGPRNGARTRRPAALGALRRAAALGVARGATAPDVGSAGAAALRLLDDGSFTLAAGPPTPGGTDETAYAEAAAAILGIPTHRIVCAAADTDSAPFESGEPALGHSGAGRAVEEAARIARDRIRDAGAAHLGAAASEVVLEGDIVRDSRGRGVSFAEIGAAALQAGRPVGATAAPSPASQPASLAAAFAEVELDSETGIVRVCRLAAVLAAGPFADERSPLAQVEGALAGALEQALAGGLGFDDQGRPLVRSMRLWPLVAAVDVPPLSVAFVPGGDPLSRFGAGALGDAAGRAALAAIVNAVARAAGGHLRELPLSPGCLLEALAATGGPGAVTKRP
jgi:putative selenate reductase molybdopterin-binding subunit